MLDLLATKLKAFLPHVNLPTLIQIVKKSQDMHASFPTALRPLIQLVEKEGQEMIDKVSEACLATI